MRQAALGFCVGLFIGVAIAWTVMSFRLARVTGDSMTPAYVRGDLVLASSLGSSETQPRRAGVELLYYPLEPRRLMVDRVIGIEGDTVRIADGHVYLNEKPFPDNSFVSDYNRGHSDWGPMVVPQGYVFVLGDNRLQSSDSRHWGFVPRRYLWGRVIARVWPRH
jgi:signal peptidase I